MYKRQGWLGGREFEITSCLRTLGGTPGEVRYTLTLKRIQDAGLNLPNNTLRPVSYTHLDVYKRQEKASAELARIYGELGKRNPFTGVTLAIEAWQRALAEVESYQDGIDEASEAKERADRKLEPLQKEVEAGTRSKDDRAYTEALDGQAKALRLSLIHI